ncbi:MAG: VPLPA-CTERM sorting domain-containing protein [Pseudomonadota bacterium]
MHRFYIAVVALVFLISVSPASASSLKVELGYGAPNNGVLIDNVSSTSDISFTLFLDSSTLDDRPFDVTFGGFLADKVLFSAPSLSIVDEEVATALEYFEDNDFGNTRVGIGPDDASTGISAFASGTTQIGDPNLLDTFPDFVAPYTTLGSGFSFTLKNGTVVDFTPSSFLQGSATIKMSQAEPEVVPLPATGVLLLGGFSVLGLLGYTRRRRVIG